MSKTTYLAKRTFRVVVSVMLVIALLLTTSLIGVNAATDQPKGEISFNKTFYDTHKEVCDKIAQGIENLDTEIYIGEYHLTSSEIANIMKTVIRMHPEFFYVITTRCMIGTDGTYVTVLCPFYRYSNAEIANYKKTLDKKIAEIIALTNDSMTDFQKAIIIHDQVILNCAYDDTEIVEEDTATKEKITSDRVTSYDALIRGRANCQGYTNAFTYLLSLVGVNSEVVESGTMDHIWTKVCIDNTYYNVDPTWDDPVQDNFGHVSHTYFLVSDDGFKNGINGSSIHSGFNTAYYKSNNTKYDNGFFRDIDTRFCYVGTDFYVIDNTYGSKYEKCLLKYNPETESIEKLVAFDYKWDNESGTGYWKGGYMSLDIYNGGLYFNTPDSVYRYDIARKTSSCVISSKSKTTTKLYFGLLINSIGEIHVAENTNPNNADTVAFIGNCPTDPKNSNVFEADVLVTVPVSEIIYGDVNGDGKVRINDATIIQKYAVAKETLDADALVRADVNKDTRVNVMDATRIQCYTSGIINTFG